MTTAIPNPATATFLGYTAGLKAWRKQDGHTVSLMVRVEFNRETNGTITLRAKDARSMNDAAGVYTISAESYDDRPRDHVGEARWALRLVGWSVCDNAEG